ncbi:MAG TPA: class A beta-lactamase [Microvirga sp.]|jgi:beta-lactamase class A|nr:class A beta-lactamase [Microvirga sp.]
MITRRSLVVGAGAGLLGGPLGRIASPSAAEDWADGLGRSFRDIEAGLKGRLGVAVLDTETGRSAGHRGGERFPMCSTFKLLAAAAVLARVDAGREDLDRRVRFGADEIMAHSPVTKERVGDGMTLAELCEATITLSDNAAGNLLLKALGGPAGLTAALRAFGDPVTRLDRWEPGLNEARPGDPRDTTSPDAMAAHLQRLVLGDALSPASRDRLAAWLLGNKTGDARLRAGVPQAWRVGDKTGTGHNGTANDVGVIWPPRRKPLVVSVYITQTKAPLAERNTAIAEVARVVTRSLAA